MRDKNKTIDPVTVCEVLAKAKILEECGGPAYLHQLIETVPHTAHIRFYAGIVKEHAERRKIIAWAADALRRGYDATEEPETIAAQLEEKLFQIRGKSGAGDSQGIGEILNECFDRMQEGTSKEGIQSGLSKINEITLGYQKSHLVIVAARPSVGKTALAMNEILFSAQNGIPVYFVSLEQSKLEVAERCISIISGVDSYRMRKGELDADEAQAVLDAGFIIRELPIFVDDNPGLSVSQIASRARYLRRRHKIGMVVVDYLQLIEPEDRRPVREQQVATISRRMKNLAKQLDIPVILLAQLNRATEKDHKASAGFKDRRPQLSNLRESGSIEQDANVVIMLHRMTETVDDEPKPTECMILIRKNRDGRTGEFWTRFSPHCLKFHDQHAEDPGDWDETPQQKTF
jgi:replicative DNA helicase